MGSLPESSTRGLLIEQVLVGGLGVHDHFTGYPFGLQSFQLFIVSSQDFKVNSMILMQFLNFIKS